MDKNAIKKYAVWARRELIEKVSQKAMQYGIEDGKEFDPKLDSINGVLLTDDEKTQRQALIRKINENGYTQVMEEVAYTWFNRFIALRFMEVNGYLPSHVRVFTDEAGDFKPQIMSEALHLELKGLDTEKVYELKNDNKDDELFKYLLITQCNDLSEILPKMFQKISDYTELLLPDYLLREGSVIERMVIQGTSDSIPESDWTDQVQIIGWLYQYYNSEPKDKVFTDLKNNIKITKDNIPAATQLFTPDWIVRYMVENSLGRLWLEGHPNNELKSEWKYYLDEADQEEEVNAQLEEIRKEYASLEPKEIRVIDPCSGSGHILCVLFDVLIRIYEDYGYTAREAATSIIKNNIWGLDIDERAAQLSYFTVMMKARQYDRRFLLKKDEKGNPDIPQPHVYVIEESNGIDSSCVEHFVDGRVELKSAMETLMKEMQDAKEYGSIINVTPVDFDALYARFDELRNAVAPSIFTYRAVNELLPLVRVGQALGQKYDAVVTNPPYMGAAGMNSKLYDFVKDVYPSTKSDMSTIFMEKTIDMCNKYGFMSMINIPVWMFIASYEKLRNAIVNNNTLTQMIHLGRGVFGSDFGTTSFVICKAQIGNYYGSYLRLFEKQGAVDSVDVKEEWFKQRKGYYTAKQSAYLHVPGCPIAYWVSNQFIDNFSGRLVQDTHFSGGRNKTHGNEKYTRLWWEISDRNRWQLYVKGGDFRRWYGNHEVVVDWSEAAKEEYASHGGLYNQEYANKCGICWTLITSAKTAFRYKIPEAHYDSGAPTIFNHEFDLDSCLLGFLNSNVATEYLSLLNPTINMGNTYVLSLPYIDAGQFSDEIKVLVDENIEKSKEDWDSFENSMDFATHPLIKWRNTGLIKDAFGEWERHALSIFKRVQFNEKRLNTIFINLYGLEKEITSEVPERDVSIRRADLQRDIRSFISYTVGCMFGRYSLDALGLAYAGGDWDSSKYKTFQADLDAIIPICDDEYFEDDIVGRFVKFVEVVYGKEPLEDNLKFIADALGGNGTSREVIRNYFINDFYADHVKIYQKRPIYWLFDSGKKNGFKCLIYMHRYQPDTIARIRTDYVHEQQARYRTAIEEIEKRIESASGSDKIKLEKKLNTLRAQDDEIHSYEEKIHHLADQMISIDLDDGVKHNYELFQDVLAKIK